MVRFTKAVCLLTGTALASLLGAYGSARSSYQPQPPTPDIAELAGWVGGMNDPLAISLVVMGAITSGLSIWQAFTSPSKKDIETIVQKDGGDTRAHVDKRADEAAAQTWTEGQASEERDQQTHAMQVEQTALLKEIVANQQAEAASKGVNAEKLVSLGRRIVEKVSDPSDAELALHRAIDELLKLREEAQQGTNFGDEVDEAIRRIFSKVEGNDLDGAARAQEAEFARLAEQAEQVQAAQGKLAETGLSVARMRYDAQEMARWAIERRKLADNVPRLGIAALRAEQDEWYKTAERLGARLDMDVAIALAKRSVDQAANAQERAMCQNDLGIALKRQGERLGGEAGIALLGESVSAYRAALEVRTRGEMPADWAMTQNNLGNALLAQGERLGGEAGVALLGEAVSAYRAALKVYTQDEMPADWAMTQNNLGGALQRQGERLGGEARLALLGESVSAYRAALKIRTLGEMPVQWAMTQNNLGAALRAQGERLGGEAGLALLGESVSAYRAALKVYTRGEMPVDWAGTQNNLGGALQRQGERLGGEARLALLGESVSAYRAALKIRTLGEMPVQWAMTQNNLGAALRAQGERLGGEAGLALLGESVSAYRAALKVRTLGEMPAQWAMTQENLGLVEEVWGDLTEGDDRIDHWRLAEQALLKALEVYDPDHMSFYHEKATKALAGIRAKIAAATSPDE